MKTLFSLLAFQLFSVCLLAQTMNVTVANVGTISQAAAGGTWAPTDEASLVVWQKADAGVTNDSGALASNGEKVAGWRDNGTKGNYSTNLAAVGDLVGYPYYLTGIQNGLPVVRFYNTNYLEASGIVSYLKGSDIPMTYAVAYKNAESGAQGAFLFEQRLRTGAGDYILAYISGAGVTGGMEGDDTTNAIYFPIQAAGQYYETNWTHYSVTWASDGVNILVVGYYNGSPYATNTLPIPWLRADNSQEGTPWIGVGVNPHDGTPQMDRLTGGDEFPNNGWYGGRIADVRIYNRALSASEITDVFNYNGGTTPPAAPSILTIQNTTIDTLYLR